MNNIEFTHFVTRFFNIKSVLSKYLSIFFFLLLFLPSQVLAEGSKEIYIGTNSTGLQLCNDFISHCSSSGVDERTQFAVYECDSSDRLNFIVNSTHEIVYLGFQGQNGFNWHIVYRIKDIHGQIVKDEEPLPESGTGYINNINEAREGPQQLGSPTGYDAIEFIPPSTGIYYIEFNRVTNDFPPQTDPGTFHIPLFDITVANTISNSAIPGRLYSQAWQFSYVPLYADCSAKFYVYSSDSIITSLQLNDMDGRYWFLYCNQTGVGNSGDFTEDRKSVGYHQAYFPQYKIFINEPDTNIFPPASTLGSIISPIIGQTHCNNGTIDFLVEVDKAGNVEIELDFDPPYVTRTLATIVGIGVNTIIWDGYDGTSPDSLPVPNNTNIEFTVSYINGLTNLPLHDIEYNSNGFVIELVYPSPDTDDSLFVFWDDSNIGGTVNLDGCYSTPDPWSGCHDWNNTNDCTH
ncbi:MAG: hypothetical protein KAW86_02445, partial [Bacteroidales bacterium]|nr:hypothetical protein [Bacteroidales bacterium]